MQLINMNTFIEKYDIGYKKTFMFWVKKSLIEDFMMSEPDAAVAVDEYEALIEPSEFEKRATYNSDPKEIALLISKNISKRSRP